jgi:Ca-activated chloride channel family protein
MRFTILTLCLGLILALTGFSSDDKPQQTPPKGPTFRADVEVVSLPVVVTNRKGQRITDLKQEDFKVYEDGIQQEIAQFVSTDEPVNVALLLDTSGSTQRKLARIQNAAITFVNSLHPDDEVAVISFADKIKLQEDFTIDRDRNEYGIKKTRTGEYTQLYDAVWYALEEILKPVWERKALVIFTDGVDTSSNKSSWKETLELAKETRATIYSVYFNTEYDEPSALSKATGTGYPSTFPSIINPYPGTARSSGSSPEKYREGRSYLSQLTDYSGGLFIDGQEDLSYAFDQVAKELASQYSIGYYSSNKKRDGKYRKVEVKLNRPELVARTKKGYFTAKARK